MKGLKYKAIPCEEMHTSKPLLSVHNTQTGRRYNVHQRRFGGFYVTQPNSKKGLRVRSLFAAKAIAKCKAKESV